ncbi:hypothetical protein R1flu_026595 [Riccia fluitans]|uniref:Uncharacterized protein n=1 Tax=Riccia fluitans TaxID=41844 RepID=A0ABD1XGD9_9MARC
MDGTSYPADVGLTSDGVREPGRVGSHLTTAWANVSLDKVHCAVVNPRQPTDINERLSATRRAREGCTGWLNPLCWALVPPLSAGSQTVVSLEAVLREERRGSAARDLEGVGYCSREPLLTDWIKLDNRWAPEGYGQEGTHQSGALVSSHPILSFLISGDPSLSELADRRGIAEAERFAGSGPIRELPRKVICQETHGRALSETANVKGPARYSVERLGMIELRGMIAPRFVILVSLWVPHSSRMRPSDLPPANAVLPDATLAAVRVGPAPAMISLCQLARCFQGVLCLVLHFAVPVPLYDLIRRSICHAVRADASCCVDGLPSRTWQGFLPGHFLPAVAGQVSFAIFSNDPLPLKSPLQPCRGLRG